MNMDLRISVLALLLTATSGMRAPTMSFNLKSKLAPPSRENVGVDFEISQQLNDKLSIGTVVALEDATTSLSPRSIFGRASNVCFSGQTINGDVEVATGKDKTFAAEFDVSGTQGLTTRVALNSQSEDSMIPYVDSVQFSQSGKGWSFVPTLNVKEMNMDLEGTAHFGVNTHGMMGVDHNGKSKFALTRRVNDKKTTLKLSSVDGFGDQVTVGVDHQLTEKDCLSASVQIKEGNNAKLGWVHRFSCMDLHTTFYQADSSVEFDITSAASCDDGVDSGGVCGTSASGGGAWAAKVVTPLLAPKETQVSIFHKLCLTNKFASIFRK